MREIFIKSRTSSNHHRKNLSIVEVINEEGVSARAEKKYSYYVAEQKNGFKDAADMNAWMHLQSHSYQKKDRHVIIRKTFDPKSGVGQMVYRVIGSFYVVQDLHVYAVVFMHSIKFDMLAGRVALPKH